MFLIRSRPTSAVRASSKARQTLAEAVPRPFEVKHVDGDIFTNYYRRHQV
jgi:hypothetical protein